VARELLAGPVRCPRCQQVFRVRPELPEEVLPSADVPLGQGPAAYESLALDDPPPEARLPRLDVGSATSPGKMRERNEDSLLACHLTWTNLDARHEVALAVVADGMGGHQAGDRASALVLRSVGASLTPLLSLPLLGQFEVEPAPLAEALVRALREANGVVHRAGQADPASRGMGATAAAALVWDGQALVSHVGDCRVYHQRADGLVQVTRDDTVAARLVEMGKMTEAEARTHPEAAQVTQAIGRRPEVQPSRQRVALAPGDWLIVACDGLQANLGLKDLEEEVFRAGTAAAELARALVRRADERGGSDNCTVVAVRCV
jgi:protein phosphatase